MNAAMNHLSYLDAFVDSHEDVMNLALFLEKKKKVQEKTNLSFHNIYQHVVQVQYCVARSEIYNTLSKNMLECPHSNNAKNI